MKAFSELLFGLYRQVHTTPPSEFQTQALDSVRQVLAFDSALWGTGVMGQQGVVVHSVCVYRQPPEMMQSWERIVIVDSDACLPARRRYIELNRSPRSARSWGDPRIPRQLRSARFRWAHYSSTPVVVTENGFAPAATGVPAVSAPVLALMV